MNEKIRYAALFFAALFTPSRLHWCVEGSWLSAKSSSRWMKASALLFTGMRDTDSAGEVTADRWLRNY